MRRRPFAARRRDPERLRRGVLVGAVALVALIWGLAVVIPALDRREATERRAAWLRSGQRETPPAAESGATRSFQERN